jgi:hypothetical protein
VIVGTVMTSIDDIKGETPAGKAAGAPDKTGPLSVGPEDESHGGSEANPKDSRRDLHYKEPDRMPGQRADLPEGSLPGPYLDPQGDENRTPPTNAPSPVKPAPTVVTPAKDR